MRVARSERIEAELEHHFAYGVKEFGRPVAERTFGRVRRFLLESLAAFPRVGVYRSGRDVYEVVIPWTPFIAYYRIDASADSLTVVALFALRARSRIRVGQAIGAHPHHATAKPDA